MSTAILHLIEPAALDHEEARARLTAGERERADRFVFERDRRRWTAVRAEVRRLLAAHGGDGALGWSESRHGKPLPAGGGPHFNLSHGGALSALLVSEAGPVGVDLEPRERGRELLEDAPYFCHPEEIAALPAEPAARAAALIDLWTAKEAFLKALGTGFSQPPEAIRVRGDRAEGPVSGLDGFRVMRFLDRRLERHALAAAVPDACGTVEIAR